MGTKTRTHPSPEVRVYAKNCVLAGRLAPESAPELLAALKFIAYAQLTISEARLFAREIIAKAEAGQ